MKILKILALVVGTAALCSCADNNENVIKIGGLSALTGTSSVYGTACSNGSKLAVKEINENGGVLGKELRFVLHDEKGDIEEAVNAYNRLIGDDITVIVGDVMSKPCAAVAELAAEDGVTLITPTATAESITSFGDSVFRVCFTDGVQGTVMARYAYEDLGAKSVAVMYNTSGDYSSGISSSFREEADILGLEICAYEGYGSEDTDFRSQLTKIKGKSPDALFLPDYYTSAALIVSQAREMGIDCVILGADGWDGITAAVSEGNISILDDCRYSAHFSPTDSEKSVSDFVKNYTEEYGHTPTSLAALGYDAVYCRRSD